MEFEDKPKEPIDINDANFDEAIKKYHVTVVDFWAPWCGPCQMMGPVIKELAKEYDGEIAFLKLDIDQNRVTAGKYAVMSIPTMKVFKNGEEVDTIVGAMPKNILKSKIDSNL